MNLKSTHFFSRQSLIAIIILLLVIIFFIGGKIIINHKDCDRSSYKLINSQIVCNEKKTINKKNYLEFKSKLLSYIENEINNNNLTEISIYFRDLKFGPTFGINEYTQFSPASLLKVPMMITYLDLFELDTEILNTKLYYKDDNYNSIIQSISPKETITPNTPYRIEDLISYMIKYSDNKSYYVLLEYLNKISPNSQLLRNTFIDLGIIDPSNEFEDTLTVKSYSGIFTQLYNSTYFTHKETSEMALEILSDTDFKQGLVAGVPPGTVVAHKFGERIDETNNVKQLHDCGIVYFYDNPYLLCVMTRGKKMEDLMNILSLISKMTYEELDSRRII